MDEAPVSKGLVDDVLDDVDALCGWLQREARISDKFIASTLQKLEAETVETVRDLQELQHAGGLEGLLPRLTETRIAAALARLSVHDGAPAATASLQPEQLVQPPQPPQSPQAQLKQTVSWTPEKPTQPPTDRQDDASQARPGVTWIAASTDSDVPDGQPNEGAVASTSEAMSVDGPRRKRRAHKKKKKQGNGSQQAGGCEDGLGSLAHTPLAAELVSQNDGVLNRGSEVPNLAKPTGQRARSSPSSASAPLGAPNAAAASRRLYKVRPQPPDRNVPWAYRRPGAVWHAIEEYDRWLHGATLYDADACRVGGSGRTSLGGLLLKVVLDAP